MIIIELHSSGQTLSRAAYAKLYTAGFPQILNRHGEPPEVVDPVDQAQNFILAKEEADRLAANEITLQFLAYARYVRNVLYCFTARRN